MRVGVGVMALLGALVAGGATEKVPQADGRRFVKSDIPRACIPGGYGGERWKTYRERFEAELATAKAGGAPVVFLGDSITHNWEAAGRGKEVWERHFASGRFRAVNFGISGDSTCNLIYRLQHGVLDGFAAKAIVLQIGTNNLKNDSAGDIRLGVKACLDLIRAKQPGATVILHPVPMCAPTPDALMRRQAIAANAELAKLADGRRVIWCEWSQRMLAPDGTIPKSMIPEGDNCHPLRPGYELWAEALLPVLAKIVPTETVSLCGPGWTLDGEAVAVPHTWNAADYDRGFADDLGADDFRRKVDGGNSVMRCATLMKAATYVRELPAPERGKRYFVRFDGVCEKAVVRVNGRFVGRHVGAFTAFCFEVTRHLQASDNQLEVEVDNRYDPEIPPASADFTMCGGIYRPVELVVTGERGIDPTRPTKLWPDAKTGRVRAEIPRLGGGCVTREYDLGPVELWTPERPKLYDLDVELDGETVRHRVGFKTVEFRADGFYLNGVRRRVRGINRHQDEIGKGWALSAADEERDFRMIKEMGCDAVRLCHYPQSENVYRLCDELGLLVWSEIPNVDYLTLTETYRQNALAMATEMIGWRGNHVSVAWWSCCNELYSSGPFKGEQPFKLGAGAVYDPAIRLLYARMKELDPTRPVVAAACRRTLATLNAVPDQIGFNVYPGWYGTETMAECVDIFLRHNPKFTTFAMTEYGAGGAAEQHQNPVRPMGQQKGDDHSEEYMTQVHVADWRQMADEERLWGAFIWVFNDFGASDRYEGFRPGVNDKGVVTADRRTKKDVFYFYKANWTATPTLHLCSKRMTSTTNDVCDVMAFSNLGKPVRLTVNGEARGEKTPDEVRVVTFGRVQLRPGENVISVASGELSETWTLRREK